MKTCSKCKQDKPLDEFSLFHPALQDGRRRPDCKGCVRARSRTAYGNDPQVARDRMKRLRATTVPAATAYVASYLADHPCVDCGEADSIVLEFDHVRGTKVCDVARMRAGGYRLWRIEAEIAKCDVRCANCHRRVTHARRVASGQP